MTDSQQCTCTGTGLNACTDCPTPWPDIPGATRAVPRITARPVSPEVERAATERARQAAADSEKAAEWIAENSSPHPLVQGRCPACNGSSLFLGSSGYVTCSRLDCPNPTAADDQLHRVRPASPLRERLAAALIARIKQSVIAGPRLPGQIGSIFAATEFDLADTAISALTEYLDIGDAEAWCKICRRVWDGKHHRCEGDAEQRLAHLQTTSEAAGRLLIRTTDERDQLAAVLREVLNTFGVFGNGPDYVRSSVVRAGQLAEWRAALPKEQP